MEAAVTSIYPLVYKVKDRNAGKPDEPSRRDRIELSVAVRSLEKMQKEAVVCQVEPRGGAWRVVSDEGPYLNGTDLAPFPLGFFTAGQQCSFMTELLRHAKARGVEIKSLVVEQDNRYSMAGSALRGDMQGDAMPVEMLVKIEADADAETIARLIRLAEQSSPAQAVMRDVMDNAFSLALNGNPLPVAGIRQSGIEEVADPLATFEAIEMDTDGSFLPDIITKVSAAEPVHGVEGGAASSLQPEQKRTLHVRGEAKLIGDGLMETVVRLFSPLGSSFRFLCGGGQSAPPALVYLAAGIGFCYMTQLGRYAHIAKQNLISYRILQRNVFNLEERESNVRGVARAEPVDTHVFIEADEPDDAARQLVRMGEQTCFLHAAMKGAYRSDIRAELNGQVLQIPADVNIDV